MSGADGIPAELLKVRNIRMATKLHELTNTILFDETIPALTVKVSFSLFIKLTQLREFGRDIVVCYILQSAIKKSKEDANANH